MHESIAKLLTLSHSLFRCGVPHFRENRYIPIRTASHFIVFDASRKSPLYTMLEVRPSGGPQVPREDNFTDGELTLSDDLCTTEADYAQWNREHPDQPYDKGHSAGSQYRRGNVTEQSDIDTLAGVCPESPRMNRNVKGPLESTILEKAEDCSHTYLVQGPIWRENYPEKGQLPGGQWIPDAVFISALFIRKKSCGVYCWVMQNEEDATAAEVTLVDIEQLTGLYLWSNVGSGSFQTNRNKLQGDTWWMKGQPK
tara:strand:- start:2418 stop:3179 length:762 start_codon:yes stop_codon:yes gene_type:complete